MMENEEDLESLGEKLYHLVSAKHADMAPKLTGMLLELPEAVVSQMLQDEALLTKALERAVAALQHDNSHTDLQPANSKPVSQVDDADSVASDSLGEQLYELIELLNTGHTEKITGMLLEQKKEVVLNLLSDPVLLEKKVNMALKTLHQHRKEESDVSDCSEQDKLEAIGERLFTLVQDIEHAHCADITGMLLELDSSILKQILTDRVMLEAAVQRAKSALENTSDQTQPEMN
ncbi:polyadenylate-binding protein 1-B [Trichomycterus rosablanca]|uniref:polyadenylate-binding protein 1-B n=1 Tax=Trichomycterus rosablanca TaxID=2290929 RepID=UPI002F35BC08